MDASRVFKHDQFWMPAFIADPYSHLSTICAIKALFSRVSAGVR